MTKLTKVLCYVVVIVILLVSSALLIFQHREEAKFYPNEFVKYPTSTNPIILVAGNSFEVKLNYSELVLGWNVSLHTKYKKVNTILQSTKYDNKSRLWTLVVKVPENTMPDLYNISIKVRTKSEEIEFVQPRAVQVLKSFPENFSFVHITDVHIGKLGLGYDTADLFKQAIDEINLIHPLFVIITGDITDHGSEGEYKEFYSLLQRFTVPTFVCVGNHDVYSSILRRREGKTYEKCIGNLNYTFNVGNFHFIVIDDVLNGDGVISKEQLEWIENDLKLHNNSIKLMMTHVPMFKPPEFSSQILEPARSSLLKLIKEHKVIGFFAWHHHRDYIVTYDECKFINTVTISAELGSGAKYHGYRIVRIVKGKIYSYNYYNLSDQDTSNSIPVGKLHYSFYPSNDGTSENVTLKIVSELLETIEDAKVKFILKKPPKTYEIKIVAFPSEAKPRVIQSFESDDHSKIIIEVALSILKNQTLTISSSTPLLLEIVNHSNFKQ